MSSPFRIFLAITGAICSWAERRKNNRKRILGSASFCEFTDLCCNFFPFLLLSLSLFVTLFFFFWGLSIEALLVDLIDNSLSILASAVCFRFC